MTTKTRKGKAKVRTRRSPAKKTGGVVRKRIGGLDGQGLLRVGATKKLELRDRLGLTRPLFSRLVDVSERTLAKVESGESSPAKLKRLYNEVFRLYEALSDVVDPESIGLWFQTPNDAFDGFKPMELVERGEIDRLWNMVFELRTGMPG